MSVCESLMTASLRFSKVLHLRPSANHGLLRLPRAQAIARSDAVRLVPLSNPASYTQDLTIRIDSAVRSPSTLKPALVLSKFPADSSFQTTPIEGYTNITEKEKQFLGKWEEKTDHRLFWRGSTTGGYGVQRDWKESHRMRLHLMVNGPKGGDTWWNQQAREIMMPDGVGGFDVVRRWERVLSAAYADVKLSGKPVQVGWWGLGGGGNADHSAPRLSYASR